MYTYTLLIVKIISFHVQDSAILILKDISIIILYLLIIGTN